MAWLSVSAAVLLLVVVGDDVAVVVAVVVAGDVVARPATVFMDEACNASSWLI